MRLTDVSKVIKIIERFKGYIDDDMILRIKIAINRLPTIDAEAIKALKAKPVKHGRWIIIYNDNKPFKAICSECGAVLLFTSKHEGEPKYCHNCGCKMDKEST